MKKQKDLILKNYKGFDKDLKCRNFKYEIGKEYEIKEKPVRCTEKGFHSCENPLDIFGYYSPSDSRFCEVEASGEIDKGNDDTKIASSKIKIGAEINLFSVIKIGVEWILGKVDFKNAKVSNTGDQSASTNTGDQSASTNTGDRSASTNTGDQSASTNTGYQSASTNTGDQSASTNTGYQSASIVEGKESIAIAMGYKSKAKGSLGCWLVLAEWDENNHIINVKSRKVDGKHIKANIFYIMENGKFVKSK